MGARQLVVQEALETTSCLEASYFSLLTPMTNIGIFLVSSALLAGAEMMTFLAPASRWPQAFSLQKRPVDSIT